jgi:hypothetical protein
VLKNWEETEFPVVQELSKVFKAFAKLSEKNTEKTAKFGALLRF